MSIPKVTLKELFEAGVHFGHNRSSWNPKMKKYIYDVRGGVHIIDIRKTVDYLNDALKELRNIASRSGRILFVGTKPHASEIIKNTALECGQYYVNHRWLGGMLTNWKTIAQSIKRMEEMEKKLETPEGLTKKETLKLQRNYDHLERALGGVRKMGGAPSALFVVDIVKENIAVLEARKLKIPVFGIADSNADPTLVTYPIPGNDDAMRAIQYYCNAAKEAILDGLQENIAARGIKLDDLKQEEPEEKIVVLVQEAVQ